MTEDTEVDRIWARTDRAMEPPQRKFARQMRARPTEAERKLWWHLRHTLSLTGSHFRRQVQIGPYVADFVSHRLKLVIEVDGGQHAMQLVQDRARTQRLELDGYRVLRFWNNEVLSNIEGVLAEIQRVTQRPPPPTPPHKGEG